MWFLTLTFLNCSTRCCLEVGELTLRRGRGDDNGYSWWRTINEHSLHTMHNPCFLEWYITIFMTCEQTHTHTHTHTHSLCYTSATTSPLPSLPTYMLIGAPPINYHMRKRTCRLIGLAHGSVLTGISPGRDTLLVDMFLRPCNPVPPWTMLLPPPTVPPLLPPASLLPWWWSRSEIMLVEFDFFIIAGDKKGGRGREKCNFSLSKNNQ